MTGIITLNFDYFNLELTESEAERVTKFIKKEIIGRRKNAVFGGGEGK